MLNLEVISFNNIKDQPIFQGSKAIVKMYNCENLILHPYLWTISNIEDVIAGQKTLR